MGDGSSREGTTIQGDWKYGDWTQVTISYKVPMCRVYENGLFLHEFLVDKLVDNTPGTLLLGSYKGTERFFTGALRNVSIVNN